MRLGLVLNRLFSMVIVAARGFQPAFTVCGANEGSYSVSFRHILDFGDFEKTGVTYTLSLISGKYKVAIIYCLLDFKVMRFNAMKKYIKTISYKTLSLMLKELEADGLVLRQEFSQVPPKVEYSLTERGKSLIPLLDALCEWGSANMVP